MAIGRTRQLSISPGMTPEMIRLIGEQRSINKEFDRRKPVTSPTVFLNDSLRPPARDNGGRIIFVMQPDKSLSGQYSDGSVWQTFLATSVSFATPTITYGTTAAAGALTTTIRSDARLKFPSALMSSANSSTLTLTDDGTDMHIACSLGGMDFNTSNNKLALPLWNACGGLGDTQTGIILRFAGNTSTFSNLLTTGIDGILNFNTADTFTSTYRGSRFGINYTTAATFTGATAQILMTEFGTESAMAGTHSFAERTALRMVLRGIRGASVTVTDSYGILADTWPLLNVSAGTYTNATFCKAQIPTIGSTIRRGIWLTTTGTTVGTASANTEGFYCEDLTIGTSRRTSYYAEGATTGTPTDVYSVYQGTAHTVGTNRYGARFTGTTTGTPTLAVGVYCDAHSVGTTKWSFYANDESRMAGVQQDDNAKVVYGTGRDAEIYYDGTDFVADPDVVGTGSFDIRGPLKCDSITNDTGLAAGTYAPTRSAEVNMDANVTMTQAQYMRVGNVVTVSGRFTANPTTAATATSFEATLPVASNIGAVEDCAGAASADVIVASASVSGSVANNTAVFQWLTGVDVASRDWSYTYTYEVI